MKTVCQDQAIVIKLDQSMQARFSRETDAMKAMVVSRILETVGSWDSAVVAAKDKIVRASTKRRLMRCSMEWAKLKMSCRFAQAVRELGHFVV